MKFGFIIHNIWENNYAIKQHQIKFIVGGVNLAKQVRGILAKNSTGYRQVWDMGKAANMKKRQKISGVNQPST